MTNLKALSNEALLSNTKDLAARERELTTQVLWHLREIEARRLFAKLSYPSLFEYAVKELGYSASSAMRRIQAMRLLKEIPQVEEALAAGKLNLSHLSAAQSFFQSERKHEGKTYSREEKFDLLSTLEGTSQRQTEKILVSLSPETVLRTQERIKPLSESHSEFKTIVSSELLKKLERVRELGAHRTKTGNWAEILELMADQAIKALDPALQKTSRTSLPAPAVKAAKNYKDKISAAKEKVPENREERVHAARERILENRNEGVHATHNATKRSSPSRYIPRALKKSLFERAQGQCEYVSPDSAKRCECRAFLQVDHILPLAQGGAGDPANLRVLCHAHNQWAALQHFGAATMLRYGSH